jgi:HlyD family secretion protein
VDEIGIGGRVTLRLSALGQRDTPQLVGRITRISADAITDPATGQVYYGIAIALPPDQRAHLDASITLLPGMPVEVFIGTVPRSALAYLIKPFADYFARALRES